MDALNTMMVGQGVVGQTGPQMPTSGLFGSAGGFDLGKITDFSNVLSQGAMSVGQLRGDARVAQDNATLTREQTRIALEKQDRERRLRAGTARATAGASGTLATGSILDIMQSSAANEALDLMMIRSEGALKESQYLSEAKQAKSQIPFSLLATAGKGARVLNTKSKGFF